MATAQTTAALASFSETRFTHRVPPGFPAPNPAVDLSATWDAAAGDLLVCRPVGQVVTKIRQVARRGKPAPEPQAVTWRPDGQFLAVGWSDGFVRLMGVENNKAAHHLRVSAPPADAGSSSTQLPSRITHIGWTSTLVGRQTPTANGKAKRTGTEPSWQEMLSKEMGIGDDDEGVVDLPREITFLEVDTALPKISPLPSASAGDGEDALVFTLRSGIDFLFQPLKSEDSDRVHVMLVGTSDGRLHLSIFDSFVVGDFTYSPLGQLPHGGPTFRLVHHASHPELSTHSVFLRSSDEDGDDGPSTLSLVPMDLSFIPSSPVNLSLLASKLTTLQNLLRYVKQTQLHMAVEYNNARELPSRFLRGVQDDLANAEQGPRSIVQALYHTVVTGHAYEPVREWLVDTLAERGHKRWDKAVVSSLENLRSLVHENLLPALVRAAIILSRLRGLARFHASREDAGFSVPQLSRAIEAVAALTLVGNKVLLLVMEELELFASFSTWLRFAVDRLAAQASGSAVAADELAETEALMDNEKVLEYVEVYLVDGPLEAYLGGIGAEEADAQADWEKVEAGADLVDMLDREIQRREARKAPVMKALPRVEFLVRYLAGKADGIFANIAEAQRRSVRFGPETRLSLGRPIGRMDARVAAIHRENGIDGITFTAMTPKGSTDELYVFRTEMSIINGISSAVSTSVSALALGEGKIIDLKFLDGNSLVVLWASKDQKPTLVQIPIQSPDMSYLPHEPSSPLPAPTPLESGPLSTQVAHLALPADESESDGDGDSEGNANASARPTFTPVQLEVLEASDIRGPTPARACLLGGDRSTYKVYALSSGEKEPRGNDGIRGGGVAGAGRMRAGPAKGGR